jgi:glycosyltransferase involved in cell wall biosynthesis
MAIESVFCLIKSSNLYIECIIVENGQAIPENIKKIYNTNQEIKLFSIDVNQGLGKARNLGFEKASGTYVMYIDDDAYIPKSSHKILNKLILNQEFDYCGGLVGNYNQKNTISRLYHNYYFEPLQLKYQQIIGTNMLFRKSELEEIGGFSLNLNRADEEYVINKLRLKCKRGLFKKDLLVNHNQPKSVQHIVNIFINNGYYRRELYYQDFSLKGNLRRLIHYLLFTGTSLLFFNFKITILFIGVRLFYSRTFHILNHGQVNKYPMTIIINLVRCYLEDYGWIKHFIKKSFFNEKNY